MSREYSASIFRYGAFGGSEFSVSYAGGNSYTCSCASGNRNVILFTSLTEKEGKEIKVRDEGINLKKRFKHKRYKITVTPFNFSEHFHKLHVTPKRFH
jgi:hypothetical protein